MQSPTWGGTRNPNRDDGSRCRLREGSDRGRPLCTGRKLSVSQGSAAPVSAAISRSGIIDLFHASEAQQEARWRWRDGNSGLLSKRFTTHARPGDGQPPHEHQSRSCRPIFVAIQRLAEKPDNFDFGNPWPCPQRRAKAVRPPCQPLMLILTQFLMECYFPWLEK